MSDHEEAAPWIDLGTCCICAGSQQVNTLITLNGQSPLPGRGWGCVACGLPGDGAQAVICQDCYDTIPGGDIRQMLRWICTGYPGNDGRTPIADLHGTHQHDMSQHQGEEIGDEG